MRALALLACLLTIYLIGIVYFQEGISTAQASTTPGALIRPTRTNGRL